MLNIEIQVGNDNPTTDSLVNGIKNLNPIKYKEDDYEPILITEKRKSKKEKKEEKRKNKKSKFAELLELNDSNSDEENERLLLDLDSIDFLDEDDDDIYGEIIDEQKRSYKKRKDNPNEYKKEFAEELTLLYNLLDETSKFGKDLEQTLKQMRGQKVRGVNKYANDLAELVLTSKQNKLNILKEISSVKKSIADLKIKSDAKNKNIENDGKSPEYLAAAYFNKLMQHGRNNFVEQYGSDDTIDYDNIVDKIENRKQGYLDVNEDSDEYMDRIEERLSLGNPFRSEEGNRYIEYETREVKIYVKRCIDTGEWRLIAIDKFNQEVDDYPLPSRKSLGRMKFSEDGQYCTDEKGRMYNVIEYYESDEDEY